MKIFAKLMLVIVAFSVSMPQSMMAAEQGDVVTLSKQELQAAMKAAAKEGAKEILDAQKPSMWRSKYTIGALFTGFAAIAFFYKRPWASGEDLDKSNARVMANLCEQLTAVGSEADKGLAAVQSNAVALDQEADNLVKQVRNLGSDLEGQRLADETAASRFKHNFEERSQAVVVSMGKQHGAALRLITEANADVFAQLAQRSQRVKKFGDDIAQLDQRLEGEDSGLARFFVAQQAAQQARWNRLGKRSKENLAKLTHLNKSAKDGAAVLEEAEQLGRDFESLRGQALLHQNLMKEQSVRYDEEARRLEAQNAELARIITQRLSHLDDGGH